MSTQDRFSTCFLRASRFCSPARLRRKQSRGGRSSGTGPKTTLYVGNSFFYYNNMLGSHVTAMNKAADPANKDKYRSTSVTIGGSGLDWHDVDSYFRPNAVGRYSFDAQKDIVFNKLDKLFDLAITTDCSQCPIHPQLKPIFSDQTARFAQTVRKHGAEPVFFMS